MLKITIDKSALKVRYENGKELHIAPLKEVEAEKYIADIREFFSNYEVILPTTTVVKTAPRLPRGELLAASDYAKLHYESIIGHFVESKTNDISETDILMELIKRGVPEEILPSTAKQILKMMKEKGVIKDEQDTEKGVIKDEQDAKTHEQLMQQIQELKEIEIELIDGIAGKTKELDSLNAETNSIKKRLGLIRDNLKEQGVETKQELSKLSLEDLPIPDIIKKLSVYKEGFTKGDVMLQFGIADNFAKSMITELYHKGLIDLMLHALNESQKGKRVYKVREAAEKVQIQLPMKEPEVEQVESRVIEKKKEKEGKLSTDERITRFISHSEHPELFTIKEYREFMLNLKVDMGQTSNNAYRDVWTMQDKNLIIITDQKKDGADLWKVLSEAQERARPTNSKEWAKCLYKDVLNELVRRNQTEIDQNDLIIEVTSRGVPKELVTATAEEILKVLRDKGVIPTPMSKITSLFKKQIKEPVKQEPVSQTAISGAAVSIEPPTFAEVSLIEDFGCPVCKSNKFLSKGSKISYGRIVMARICASCNKYYQVDLSNLVIAALNRQDGQTEIELKRATKAFPKGFTNLLETLVSKGQVKVSDGKYSVVIKPKPREHPERNIAENVPVIPTQLIERDTETEIRSTLEKLPDQFKTDDYEELTKGAIYSAHSDLEMAVKEGLVEEVGRSQWVKVKHSGVTKAVIPEHTTESGGAHKETEKVILSISPA